jgi:hypothetical protein
MPRVDYWKWVRMETREFFKGNVFERFWPLMILCLTFAFGIKLLGWW